jgi:hypothetical protein
VAALRTARSIAGSMLQALPVNHLYAESRAGRELLHAEFGL